jgi:hypothetical protein
VGTANLSSKFDLIHVFVCWRNTVTVSKAGSGGATTGNFTPDSSQKRPKTINVNIKNVIILFPKLMLTHITWTSLFSIYVFNLDFEYRKITPRRFKQ